MKYAIKLLEDHRNFLINWLKTVKKKIDKDYYYKIIDELEKAIQILKEAGK